MVFREEYGEHFGTLLYHGSYHPYRRYGETNPSFNAYSALLLDLKDNKIRAIEHFREFLQKRVAEDVPIAVVPSHDPAKTTSGLRTVAQRLAAADRIDATGCLVRTKRVDKLAHGGDRSIEVHLASIEVRDAHLFQGMNVLLLDDITTTGNSLEACCRLLLEAGAARVQKLAFGKTV
jgi:predicted amidophosphoribosyltransferase